MLYSASFLCQSSRKRAPSESGREAVWVPLPYLDTLIFHARIENVYQINFNANCICLDEVVVLDIKPAVVFGAPATVKT